MIKFFRRIRQKLLAENKFKNYLLYGAGEILLVVIGILLALQVNNWNNERIEKNQIFSFLQNFQDDLKADILGYENRIDFLKEIIQYKEKVLSMSEFTNLSIDSLYIFISSRDCDININTTTFSKIKNLGLSLNSQNIKLSNAVDEYYVNSISNLKDFIEWDSEIAQKTRAYWFLTQEEFELNMTPFYINSPNIMMFQDSITAKQNLIKLISEPKGRNLLKMDYVTKKILLEQYMEAKSEALQLISVIENEKLNS